MHPISFFKLISFNEAGTILKQFKSRSHSSRIPWFLQIERPIKDQVKRPIHKNGMPTSVKWHISDVNCMKKYLNEETLAEEKYSKYFLELILKLQRKAYRN